MTILIILCSGNHLPMHRRVKIFQLQDNITSTSLPKYLKDIQMFGEVPKEVTDNE